VRLQTLFLLLGALATAAGAQKPTHTRSQIRSTQEPQAEEASAVLVTSDKPHKVRDLSDPALALDLRLAAIESLEAGDEIAVESYIFSTDKIGKLVLRRLVEKKKKLGDQLKVRILVDGFPSPNDTVSIDSVVAKALGDVGIEFKIYNSAAILNIPKVIRRNHRKLFIVKKKDRDPLVITGGRNIANEYFNQNTKKNFIDRDILIEGPLGNEILESFNQQFMDKRAKAVAGYLAAAPKRPSTIMPASPRGLQEAEDDYKKSLARYQSRWDRAQSIVNPTFEEIQADKDFQKEMHQKAGPAASARSTLIANKVSFFSDPPGLKFSEHTAAKILSEELKTAKTSLFIENFQYSPKGEIKRTINELAKSNVQITALTNGKQASEYGILHYFTQRGEKAAKKVSSKNFHFYNYRGRAQVYNDMKEAIPDSKVQAIIHSKSIVKDGKDTFVTTFNLAARSSFLNSECGIIVHDQPELASSVVESTWSRMRDAKIFQPIIKDGETVKPERYEDGPGFLYSTIFGPLSLLVENNF
jgi:cardiolipin synthase C